MSIYRQCFRIASRCLLTQTSPKPTVRAIHRWVAPTLKEIERRRRKIGPEAPQSRSSYLEWNFEAELYAFGKRLNENFDRAILKKAVTHRAYVNLKKIEAEKNETTVEDIPDNWDMIRDGNDIISKYIYDKYSKKLPKDVMKAVHDYLTSTVMLSHVALHLGLKDLILTTEFPLEKETLADTFKAIVSAVKESQDLERANLFVNDFLVCQIHDKDIDDIWNPENPYEYLQNLAKEKGLNDVEPRLCNESASNTILANYQVGIYSNKKLIGIGWGESINNAKNSAALDAIHKINNLSL